MITILFLTTENFSLNLTFSRSNLSNLIMMMVGIASRASTRLLLIRYESRCFASSLSSFDSTPEQKTQALIDRIIRVDQAGELAADRIYAGQMAVLGRTDVGPTIQVHGEIS